MARKTNQTKRSKKSSKPMRAVASSGSTQGVAPEQVDEVETGDTVTSADPQAPAPKRSATRNARPYQRRATSPTARLAGVPTYSISKEQEYAFIREDLRRLLVTAGVLIVVMIALLFLIDR